jgi:hypothetical protein
MLGALVTLIVVIVGAVLIIAILGYGIYITFYPLIMTVKGGIDAMKEHAEEEKKVPAKGSTSTPSGRVRRARKEEQRGVQKRGHTSQR